MSPDPPPPDPEPEPEPENEPPTAVASYSPNPAQITKGNQLVVTLDGRIVYETVVGG